MAEKINESVRSELELDGHIYIIEYDDNDNIVSRDEIDGEAVLRLLLGVLSDALENPFLDKILAAKE